MRVLLLGRRIVGYRAAFLFPFFRFRDELAKRNLSIHFTDDPMSLHGGGTLIVTSEWLRQTGLENHVEETQELLAGFRPRFDSVYFFDMTDGATSVFSYVLPYVDKYLKGWILKDTSLYSRQHYQNRIYCDFYHRQFGVEDERLHFQYPPVPAAQLSKITLAWNYALYCFGPWNHLTIRIYEHLPGSWQSRFRSGFAFSDERSQRITMRINLRYDLRTVRYQREQAAEALRPYGVQTGRLSVPEYFRELRQSRVSVSPFAWGEVCIRDFETFISGAALVKPDMDHLATYPDLFIKDETYTTYRWDGSNLPQVVEELLAGDRWKELARRGQNNFRFWVSRGQGEAKLCARLLEVLGLEP